MSSPQPGPPPSGFMSSTITLSPMAQTYVDNAGTQIGPWVLGALVDMFLQGILAAQITNYFTFRLHDSTYQRFTWLVILVTFLCIVKSTQNIVIVWNTVVTNFVNPDVASTLAFTYWWDYTTSLSTAVIAIIVQSFFVYRYWLLSRRWYVCGVIVAGMVLSLVAACLVVWTLSEGHLTQTPVWSLVHFISAVITDVLITTLTAYHLYQQKSIVHSTTVSPTHSYPTNNGLTSMELRTAKSTSDMIDRLIRMIWKSALPPTLCVIVNAVLVRAMYTVSVHITFNMALPKLYVMSLMYTLNTRNDMRGRRSIIDDISAHARPPEPLRFRLGGTSSSTGTADATYQRSISGLDPGHDRMGRNEMRNDGLRRRSTSTRRYDVGPALTDLKGKDGSDFELKDLELGTDQIKSLPMRDEDDTSL